MSDEQDMRHLLIKMLTARDEHGELARHMGQLLYVIADKSQSIEHWCRELDDQAEQRQRSTKAPANADTNGAVFTVKKTINR